MLLYVSLALLNILHSRSVLFYHDKRIISKGATYMCLKSMLRIYSKEEFKMEENKIIAVAAQSSEKKSIVDVLRKEVIGLDLHTGYRVVVNYISTTKGALTELVQYKKANGKDNVILTKNVEFNITDVIGDVIKNKVNALSRVATDICLEDVLPILEDISWCCRLD